MHARLSLIYCVIELLSALGLLLVSRNSQPDLTPSHCTRSLL
jgi:hypothetical protein